MVLTMESNMAEVVVVEVRDCPVCESPMCKVMDIWFCDICGSADDKEESD